MRRLMYILFAIQAILLSFMFSGQPAQAQTPEPVWEAQFFNNAFLGEPAVFTRQTQEISYDWGFGSPGAGIDANEFSARWATDAFFEAGTYRFWVLADDNVSITIDFQNTIIDTFDTDQVDQVISADVTLSAGSHHIQVDYRELTNEAFVYVAFANLAENPTAPNFAQPPREPIVGGQWTAEYYANQNLSGSPTAIINEQTPSEDWGTGSPLPSLPVNNWSARWTATLPLEGGDYEISVLADDGVRVYVDGILVIDEWHSATGRTYTVSRSLARANHTFVIEYYENLGLASLDYNLSRITDPQQPPSQDRTTATVTAFRLNVRDEPSVQQGNVITRITRGETYPVLAFNPERTWARLSIGNTTGWVNTTFVNFSNVVDVPTVDPGDDPQATGFIVTATPFTVNIRTGPGTRFRDIGNLPAGETAEVIGRNADSTWWQINYNGIEGWVSAEYALLEAGANAADIPITS